MLVLTDNVGTYEYMAPECFKNERYAYELFKIDVWAVGVMCYHLLNKDIPFKRQNTKSGTISAAIKQGKYQWLINVSKQCKHFVKQLLNINHKKRRNAEQALQHEWITVEAQKFKQSLKIDVNYHFFCCFIFLSFFLFHVFFSEQAHIF